MEQAFALFGFVVPPAARAAAAGLPLAESVDRIAERLGVPKHLRPLIAELAAA